MDSGVYCSAPWRGVTVRENGDVKTCCAGKTPLGNLNSKSIREILHHSDALEEIKSYLLDGRQHSNCAECIMHDQQHNTAPLRQHYQTHYPLDDFTYKLRFVDVRWNNKCNLACQYCSPTFSSVWEDRLGLPTTSPRKNYQDDLLEWVLEKSHELKELMLVGGEPMLMKQNYELLKQLPQDCRISIITNFAYDLATLPCFNDLLQRPRDNVIWNISIENIGQQLEYVRNGIQWDRFLANLKLVLEHWPDSVSFNMVYSMFNALDLYDIVKYYHQQGVKKITLMPITGHPEISAFNMPSPIKQRLVEVLDRISAWHTDTYGVDADLYPISGLQSIRLGLTQSNNKSTVTKQNFYEKVQWYDSWSTLKFNVLWPDTIDMIERYLQ